MIDTLSTLHVVVNLLALLASGTLVVLLLRHRRERTARPLLWLASTLFVGAVAHALLVQSEFTVLGHILERDVQNEWQAVFVYVTTISAGCWFVFTLRYTGRSGRAGRIATRFTALLVAATVVVVTVLLGTLTRNGPALDSLALLLKYLPLLLEILSLIGVILLITTASRQPALPFRQAAVLSAGAGVLVASRVVAQGTLQPMAVSTGFALSSGLFGAALWRYRIFETPPAATVVGRDRVIESISEGVVVVDREQQVYDCNRRAEALLDLDRSKACGQPISVVQPAVPEPRRIAEGETAVRVRIPHGPLISIVATEVRDDRDRLFGYTLVARDVTEQFSRERRLALLNQLLVDVAHDRMETVARQVTQLTSGDPTDRQQARVGDQVWDATTELVTLVSRTREIEQALTAETDRIATVRTNVPTTVRTVVDEFVEGETDVVTRLPDDRQLATVDETLVEVAIRTLLEDVTGTPSDVVVVEVEQSEVGGVTVRIDVTVPPDLTPTDVSTVIDELSVQVARLAVNCVGGQVAIDETDRTRTVRIRLPTERRELSVDDEIPRSGGVRS
jgi:PAS domain-containing protein